MISHLFTNIQLNQISHIIKSLTGFR